MRVSICVSGHMRSYKSCNPSMRICLLDPFNSDIFVHTWSVLGLTSFMDGPLIYNKQTNREIETINQYYTPKSIVVEQQIKFNQTSRYGKYLVDNRNVDGVVSMFYKIYKAYELQKQYEKANNFRYDITIRCRPDLYFLTPLKHEWLNEALNDNCLYLPKKGHWTGLNDMFAFGNQFVMNHYSNLYMHLGDIAPKCPFRPEDLLKCHIESLGIKIKFVDVDFHIKRGNGTIFELR